MAKKGEERAATLSRTIQFYVTRLYELEGGSEPRPAAKAGSVWQDLSGRRYDDAAKPGTALELGLRRRITDYIDEAVEVRKAHDGAYEGRIFRTKYRDFPLTGRGQSDAPLALEPKWGLRHPTHFVWWDLARYPSVNGIPVPNEGLLGAEFTVDGPRITALQDYVLNRSERSLRLDVVPVIDSDVWDTLKRANYKVRSLDVRVPYRAETLQVDGKGMSGLDLPGSIDGVEAFAWQVFPRPRSLLDVRAVTDRLRGIVRSKEDVVVAVKMLDGSIVDLAQAKVKRSVRVVKMTDGTRSVDRASMFKEIRDAFDETRDKLLPGLGRRDIATGKPAAKKSPSGENP